MTRADNREFVRNLLPVLGLILHAALVIRRTTRGFRAL